MERYGAVDVSKESLEVKATGDKTSKKYAYNPKGMKKIASKLSNAKVILVVVEATGGYERAICRALWAAGLQVSIINPCRSHNFQKALGINAKTDPIDASMLLRFGEALKPEPTPQPSKELERLRDLFSRRQQLVETMTQEKNRLAAPVCAEVKQNIKSLLRILSAQIKTIDEKLRNGLQDSPELASKAKALDGIKAVGPVLKAGLIAQLPELGTLNRKKIAALVGVAPFDNRSGKSDSPRSIKGGRKYLRSVLYMATLAAIRCNPVIKDFYKRLAPKKDKKKIAIVAAMRKFLIYLNSVARTHLQGMALVTDVP